MSVSRVKKNEEKNMQKNIRDIIIRNFSEERPGSWSQIYLFEYDPDAWFEKYILGKKQNETGALTFGKQVGGRLEKDPNFLPQIPRDGIMEYPMKAKLGDIWLVGYADCYRPSPSRLDEYKTGKKPWDQKRVDDHGQLTMYCLLEYLINGTKPEDTEIWLHWMPTKENGDFSVSFSGEDFQHFQTKRTTDDIFYFGMRINKVIKEMEEYVNKNLSRVND